jgi:cell division protein FtsL
MNKLHYVIGTILVILVVSISVLFSQIMTLQHTIHVINDTNQQLAENLTRYQDLIGAIPGNYSSPSFQLKTEVYVAQAVSTQPVTEIQVGKP